MAGNEPKMVDIRKMGKKGGLARAQSLTPEERREAARKAAEARWGVKTKKTK